MKTKFYSFLIILICSFSFQLNAQGDISNIFKSGVADLNKVAVGYLTPAGNSISSALGSNWYNTTKTQNVWGFDLRIGADVVQVPTSDQMFSLSGLTNLVSVNPDIKQAPSFAGNGKGTELRLMQPKFLSDGHTSNPMYEDGTGVITSFTTPNGVSKYVPSASIQLTLGLPLGNDLMVRFIPSTKVKGFEASQWGVGLKHDFKQWIPVIKMLPFDASVLVAYNKLNVDYLFPVSSQITPSKLVSGELEYIPDPQSSDYSTQAFIMSAHAITANIIVSKKIAFITPYLGFGVTQSHYNLTMVGNYPTLGDPVQSGNTYKVQIINITDPIKLSSTQMMPGTTIGLKFNILMVLSLHAQYTVQKYPTASVGFGVTMR